MFDFRDSDGITTIIFFFILSAIAHFGSLVFEKNAFVKMGLLTMAIGGTLLWLNYSTLTSMIPEPAMPDGIFYNYVISVGTFQETKGNILLPANWTSFINYFLPLSLYTIFWTASFFKLKEKQV